MESFNDKKKKEKKTSFFCCSSSSGNKRTVRKDLTTKDTREEKHSRKNSLSGKGSVGSSSNSVAHEVNSKLDKIKEKKNIPKVPLKVNSDLNNLSHQSVNVNIPDKITLPNTETTSNNMMMQNPNLISNRKNSNQVKQNLNNKFEEAAMENPMATGLKFKNMPTKVSNKNSAVTKRKETYEIASPKISARQESKGNAYSSISKDKLSVKEGVDFTFKNSVVENNSAMKCSSSQYQSHGNTNEILDYLKERDAYKHSVVTVIKNNSHPHLDKEEHFVLAREEGTVTNPLTVKNDQDDRPKTLNTEENLVVEDEYCVEELDIISESQSIISSQILSHINTPKMIGGIKSTSEQSFVLSNYSKSELSRLDTRNNYLLTEHNITPHSGTDDTEYEIMNENCDRFYKFIETPKSSNVLFSNIIVNDSKMKNSQSLQSLTSSQNGHVNNAHSNPQIRDMNDRLSRKERETKRLNEKIQKLVSDLHLMEEEAKRTERKIEKEEAEGEMLRHMMNFLTSNA